LIPTIPRCETRHIIFASLICIFQPKTALASDASLITIAIHRTARSSDTGQNYIVINKSPKFPTKDGGATMQKIRVFTAGLLFVTGIILAGSDGPYFPIINFAGAGLFCLVPVLARRIK
jgi:hypothetical protein